MKLRAKRNGFTIVELLIVIVVIAVLAAISIVAYNGIQQRARNAQTLAAAKEYKKIMLSYASVYGVYPNGGTNYCLGSGYVDNLCWDNRNYTPSTLANDEMKKIAPNLPTPSTYRVYRNVTDGYRAGILYVNNFTLRYQLEGADTECALEGATRSFNTGESSGPECTISLPSPASL